MQSLTGGATFWVVIDALLAWVLAVVAVPGPAWNLVWGRVVTLPGPVEGPDT